MVSDLDTLDFEVWLNYGIVNKWCGPAVCATHDGMPTTDSEDEAMWEDGDDICIHIIRLYPDSETADAVEVNHHPSQWRKTR